MPHDYWQAQQWYEKAAAQGLAEAQLNLGLLYGNGLGMPQNYGQARAWWKKAASQGNAKAQYNLGVLYDNGYGVTQDFVQAHKWHSLAAANGHKEAALFRDAIAKQMTSAQIDEAQKLTQEWKPIKK